MSKRLNLILGLILAVLFLSAFAPVWQRQVYDWLVVKKLTVQEGGATFNSDLTADDVTVDDLTVTHLVSRSTYLRDQDVAAAPNIYVAASIPTTTTVIATSVLGIETPRNAVIALTSDVTRTAGSLVVAGVDARGNAASEVLAMTASASLETLTGAVPWVSITSFTVPTQTAAFTLTVTGGQRFGLPIIPEVAGDVYHLTVNATPQAAPTINATYGSFDPVSTPAASVDYNVWMKQ